MMCNMKLVKNIAAYMMVVIIIFANINVYEEIFAESDIKISSSDLDVGYKDEFDLSVNIENNSGIMGYGFEISYDSDYVRPISTSSGGLIISGNYDDSIGTKYDNPFRVIWSNTDSISDDGEIFSVKFETLKCGNTNIKIESMNDDTYDGNYNKINIDALTVSVNISCEHSYVEDVVKESTCTEKGIRGYRCSICDDYYEEYIPKKEHSYEETIEEPTCTKDGKKVYICSDCGYSYEEIIKASGHDYEDTVVEPTCTSKGYTKHKCKNCDSEYIDSYMDMTEHNYEIVTVEPGCETKGYDIHTCKVCGDKYIDNYVEAKGHNWKTIDYVAPTCTDEGHTEEVICEDCGFVLSEGIKLDKLGHDYDKIIYEATCTEDGYTKYICKHCGESYRTNEVKAIGHNYELVYKKEATTKESGKEVYKCSRCGLEYTKDLPILESNKSENNGQKDVKVEKVKIKSIHKSKNNKKISIVLKNKLQNEANGIEIRVYKNKKYAKKHASKFLLGKILKGRKKKYNIKSKKFKTKKLFVVVRSYRIVNGKKEYGDWSNVKKVKVRK